jgi:hypothetical protein
MWVDECNRRDVDTESSRCCPPAVRARMPTLLADVANALAGGWPDYADFLRHNRAEVAKAAEKALERFLLGGAQGGGVEQHLFEEIGRIQWEGGRPGRPAIGLSDRGSGALAASGRHRDDGQGVSAGLRAARQRGLLVRRQTYVVLGSRIRPQAGSGGRSPRAVPRLVSRAPARARTRSGSNSDRGWTSGVGLAQ